jgi:hypothetical protein
VSLFSCQKQEENPSTVFGYAFDKFTQEPILGAEVHLFQSEFTSFFSPDRITFLETTLSDKDGFFEFQFEELDFPFSHFVYVEEHGFFPEQKDAEKNMEILLEPQANIQLHIKNVNPFNEDDYLAINSPCGAYFFHGKEIDTTIQCAIFYNRNSAMSFAITKNNQVEEIIDRIFIEYGENNFEYQLFY